MITIEDRLRTLSDGASVAPELGAVVERGQRFQRRRRNQRIAVAATVAAAALFVVPVLSLVGHRPVSTSAASSFLNAVADRAAAQRAADTANAPYWYSESKFVYGDLKFTRQAWLGHHQPGRLIQPDGTTGTTSLGVAKFNVGTTALSWDEMLALPRDPATLYDWMRNAVGDAGPNPDSEMFVAVGDLLRESPAPPTLRQALFKVAARIPDVALAEGLHDALGRAATGVSRADPSGGGTIRYLIDPRTGALLEEQDLNADGTLAIRTTFVVSGPVSDTKTAIKPA